MPQNTSSKRARKQDKKPKGRGVQHELIDPTTILMPQTNPLTNTKVQDDTIERVKNGNTIKCMVIVLIARRLMGKPRTYKPLFRVRE